MESSLSVVLPVRNQADSLPEQVESLLETIADLTRHFEVLIVDDGSDDHTDEVASELCRRYPQLRVTRHPFPQGHEAAVRTGLLASRGDVVFIQEGDEQVSSRELLQLWEQRDNDQLIMARASTEPQPISPRLLGRLQTWGLMLRRSKQVAEPKQGLRMIRRNALRSAAALPANVKPEVESLRH